MKTMTFFLLSDDTDGVKDIIKVLLVIIVVYYRRVYESGEDVHL